MGGTDGYSKWLRRFISSAVLALSVNIIALVLSNWHWQYILTYIPLCIGFSLPYGTDSLTQKVVKRALFAFGVSNACLICLWATGFTSFGWVLVIMSFIGGLLSIVLGAINPYNNAPLEQFIICQYLTLLIPFWPFVR